MVVRRKMRISLTLLAPFWLFRFAYADFRSSPDLQSTDILKSRIEDLAAIVNKSFLTKRCIHIILPNSLHSVDGAVLEALLQQHIQLPILLDLSEERKFNRTCRGVLVLAPEPNLIYRRLKTMTLSASISLLFVFTRAGNSTWKSDTFANLLGESNVSVMWLNGSQRTCWRLAPAVHDPRHWQDACSELNVFPSHADTRNFRGRVLRIATFDLPPYSYIEDPDNITSVDGVEWSIVKLLASKLNFTLSLVIPHSRDKYGKPSAKLDKWIGGVYGLVFRGKADLAINSLWIHEDQGKFVNFTVSLQQSCVTFLVPRPKPQRSSGETIFHPLQWPIWIACFFSIAITAYLCLHLNRHQIYANRKSLFDTALGSLLTLLGVSATTSIPASSPTLGAHRHIINWWCMFSVLMATAYSSGLVSQLALREFEIPINNLEDLIRNKLGWGLKFKPNKGILFNLDNPVHKQFAESMILFKSDSEWLKAVREEKLAVQGHATENGYFVWASECDIPDDVLDNLRVMHTCISKYHNTFAVKRESPFLQPFNYILSHIKEAGITNYWWKKVLYTRGRKSVFELQHEKHKHLEPEPQKLDLYKLWGAFELFITGQLLAMFVFSLEWYTHRSKNRCCAIIRRYLFNKSP